LDNFFKNIIPIDSGISEDMLLRYLRDQASRAEARLIDRAIVNDPVFSDAVEGLMQLPKTELTAIFENMDGRLSKRQTDNLQSGASQNSKLKTQPSNLPNTEGGNFDEKGEWSGEGEADLTVVHRRPLRRIWWAAASVAVLCGAGIWLLTRTAPTPQDFANQSVAEELPIKKTEDIAPLASMDTLKLPPQYPALPNAKTTTTAGNADPNANYAQTDAATIASASSTETGLMPPPPQAEVAPTLATEKLPDAVVTTEYAKTKPNLKDDRITVSEGRIPAKAEPQKPYSTTNIPLGNPTKEVVNADFEEKTAPATQNDRAVTANKPVTAKRREQAQNDPTGTYSGAAAQNAAPRDYAPTVKLTTAQIFQRGEAAYAQNEYIVAAYDFEQVLKVEKKGDLYEKTSWLLANAYLKMNQKKDAKRLLNRIITEGGQFGESAKTLLSRIGD
jgi:hypothetical protein